MRFELGKLELFGLDLGSLWQRWWRGLNSMLPVSLVDIFLRPAPRVRVRMVDDALIVEAGRSHQCKELMRLGQTEVALLDDGSLHEQLLAVTGKEPAQLDLIVPESQVLRRHLTLPAAARSNLRALLGFQISKLTPFTREQVFFDGLETGVVKDSGMLEVELVVVPKTFAGVWMEHAARVTGLPVARLQVPQTQGQAGRSNLLGGLAVPSNWLKRLNINALLAGLLVLCMGLALLSPVLKLRMQMMQGKQEIATLDAQLADVRADWYSLQDNSASLAYMLEQQAYHGRPVAILAELTSLLPDGVFLTSMVLNKDRVEINGEGRNVVELVELLNASSLFEQARFSSAVTRGRNNMDVFSIGMQLAATRSPPADEEAEAKP